MKRQNRPYSLIQIFDNLRGKIKKPLLQSSIDNLISQQQLQVKEFGKSKIYMCNQSIFPEVSEQEKTDLKERDKTLSKEVQDMNTHL